MIPAYQTPSHTRIRSPGISLRPINEARCRLYTKGNQYIWKEYEDNERAFTESSIIWRLGDEYERVGNNCLKKYWRCCRAVGHQLANPGRNLYSIHSFLHTNLLILVLNVSPVLEIPRKDVTPIGYRGTRSSGRVFAYDPPKPAVRTTGVSEDCNVEPRNELEMGTGVCRFKDDP